MPPFGRRKKDNQPYPKTPRKGEQNIRFSPEEEEEILGIKGKIWPKEKIAEGIMEAKNSGFVREGEGSAKGEFLLTGEGKDKFFTNICVVCRKMKMKRVPGGSPKYVYKYRCSNCGSAYTQVFHGDVSTVYVG